MDDIGREAGFEQKPGRLRPRPFSLRDIVQRRSAAERRDRRIVRSELGCRRQRMPPELLVPLIRSGELVLGGNLPGETERPTFYVLILDARRAVGIERVRNDGVGALVSRRRQKP